MHGDMPQNVASGEGATKEIIKSEKEYAGNSK